MTCRVDNLPTCDEGFVIREFLNIYFKNSDMQSHPYIRMMKNRTA
jgi:hypothetical protein